ncbi:MAG: hypothetical protein AAFR63_13145 [Cyanobacteria bacterium J06631_6]
MKNTYYEPEFDHWQYSSEAFYSQEYKNEKSAIAFFKEKNDKRSR